VRGEPHVVLEPPAVPLTVPEPEAAKELLLLVESAAPRKNDRNVAKRSVMLLCDMAQSRATSRVCEGCLPGVHGEERVPALGRSLAGVLGDRALGAFTLGESRVS
jgi:hypothetical protein